MFRSFFLNKDWFLWSLGGSALITFVTWYTVQLQVKLNKWFGAFYDTLQKALTEAGSVTMDELIQHALTFAEIACTLIVINVLLSFFIRHYVFRWRTAMHDYYMQHWPKIHQIEGAAQRIQEDTMRFASIVEGLGTALLSSILTLVAFLPLLMELGEGLEVYPWLEGVPHPLVLLAIFSGLGGTILVAIVGIKLPGLEYNNQMVEAALRKELVFGEDFEDRAAPPTMKELFSNVRKNYFRLYKHYLYFDVAKWSYLQAAVILPLIFLVPSILAASITFGTFSQISRAFGNVEDSFQFLVRSWSTIVELLSIHKRLKAFEEKMKEAGVELN